jgi:hypothetical protein
VRDRPLRTEPAPGCRRPRRSRTAARRSSHRDHPGHAANGVATRAFSYVRRRRRPLGAPCAFRSIDEEPGSRREALRRAATAPGPTAGRRPPQ